MTPAPIDRYGHDVLAAARTATPRSRPVPADVGLVVEEVQTGWVGAIVRVEKSGGIYLVELADRRDRRRSFPLGPGFWIDGKPVRLVPPTTPAPARPTRTASGSVAVPNVRARVARTSRIWVEGRHDAELVEKIWGADLRIEGVVVEELGGVDVLGERLAQFEPAPGRRVGVLVDHLVAGSKETMIAAQARSGPFAEHVLVLGHPFIDIWQAVVPERLGIAGWPQVPRGEDFKTGTLARLGWPHAQAADIAAGWQRILRAVHTLGDVRPELSGRVEQLIDFVTAAD